MYAMLSYKPNPNQVIPTFTNISSDRAAAAALTKTEPRSSAPFFFATASHYALSPLPLAPRFLTKHSSSPKDLALPQPALVSTDAALRSR